MTLGQRMHKELRTGEKVLRKDAPLGQLRSRRANHCTKGADGAEPEALVLGGLRPAASSTNWDHRAGALSPRRRAREKRRPGRKGAGRGAKAPSRALTRPLLPEAFDSLTGGRGSAAVGTWPIPPYALHRRRGRSRGPDGRS